MNFNKKKYIDEVLKLIVASHKVKKRVKEDLNQRIDEAKDDDAYYDVYKQMGTPSELAEEFNINLKEKQDYYAVSYGFKRSIKKFEYKSEKTLFGLPLVHINTGGKYVNKTAKGIIAIGDISFGVISIGGISTGIIAIGGVGVGVFSLGGIAIGGVAFGTVAIGGVAIGAVAVGAYAFGAAAIGFVKVLGEVIHLFN